MWIKRGLIFSPKGQYDWCITHAMLPVADRIEGDFYRIYFSGRDTNNRSKIGYVEINLKQPSKVLNISEKPILDIGDLGAFDDNGVSPTCIINHGNIKYLYYMGWNKGATVRAAEVSGLAISIDGGREFVRYSRAPIMHRTDNEPFSILVISSIIIEGDLWRMWYDSADTWLSKDLPRYNVKYAESGPGVKGVDWIRKGVVSVDYNNNNETRISRASVIKESGIYKMWYCYALGSGGYKIGYAESSDGINFSRKDNLAGIELSDHGWDSEMICYPYVFVHNGQKIMLYCGNGYGKTGFGYAVWEDDPS